MVQLAIEDCSAGEVDQAYEGLSFSFALMN